MTEKINKNDFVELDFTAMTLPDETVFDTTSKSEAVNAGINTGKVEFKPSIISIGQQMLIPGLDKELEKKEIGKQYEQIFEPEQAFGKRNLGLVKMVSLRQFANQNIAPQKGMSLSLDGRLAKIVSVSGGRVLVDFNNPLAGKKVKYKFKINKKITDQNQKINSLQDFFFRKQFPFEIKDKKIIFSVEKNIQPFIQMMSKSFEEILSMKVEAKSEEKKKKEKKGETKPKVSEDEKNDKV